MVVLYRDYKGTVLLRIQTPVLSSMLSDLKGAGHDRHHCVGIGGQGWAMRMRHLRSEIQDQRSIVGFGLETTETSYVQEREQNGRVA